MAIRRPSNFASAPTVFAPSRLIAFDWHERAYHQLTFYVQCVTRACSAGPEEIPMNRFGFLGKKCVVGSPWVPGNADDADTRR